MRNILTTLFLILSVSIISYSQKIHINNTIKIIDIKKLKTDYIPNNRIIYDNIYDLKIEPLKEDYRYYLNNTYEFKYYLNKPHIRKNIYYYLDN
jgi:hypothetical protein